jgi:hypothetical protein
MFSPAHLPRLVPRSRSAGGLLTADGSGDDLIKLEGVPQGKKFSWTDDPLDAPPPPSAATASPDVVPDPDDVGPTREDMTREVEEGDNMIEDEDDEDEEDAPPAPRSAPEGFRIVDEPPPAAALVPKDPEQQRLVGRSMLYCWPSVGWCIGLIKEANGDRRFKMEGESTFMSTTRSMTTPRGTCSSSTSTEATRSTHGCCWRRSHRGCRVGSGPWGGVIS